MRNIFLFMILAVTGIGIIFSSCGLHEPSPTTSSTTTTTMPARTFIGVTLGDSTNEVISVLGQPGSIYYQDVYLVYDYYPVERRVLFEQPSEEVVAVVSAKSNDELNGIRPDMIDRFMTGERIFRLDSAGKVAEVLGLELRPKEGGEAR